MIKINLCLFDGEGASGEGTAPAAAEQGKMSEKVVYGKQPTEEVNTQPQGETKVTSNTLEDRKKAYYEMINGEYKDLYTEDTQKIINKRFKETKNLEAKLESYNPVMDVLSQRYGETDPAKLAEKIQADSRYWEDAAEDAGMTVEQYRSLKKLESENRRLLEQQQKLNAERDAQERVAQWTAEEQQLKSKFPSFNLRNEIQNPEFARLLKSGVPMEHAFKVLHMDDIVSETMRTTAAQAEKAVTQNVIARGTRPAENGTSSQSAFTVKDDVSKLSKKDRAEIAKRVKSGANISF